MELDIDLTIRGTWNLGAGSPSGPPPIPLCEVLGHTQSCGKKDSGHLATKGHTHSVLLSI